MDMVQKRKTEGAFAPLRFCMNMEDFTTEGERSFLCLWLGSFGNSLFPPSVSARVQIVHLGKALELVVLVFLLHLVGVADCDALKFSALVPDDACVAHDVLSLRL